MEAGRQRCAVAPRRLKTGPLGKEENRFSFLVAYACTHAGGRRCGQERDGYETHIFLELVEITDGTPTCRYRFECRVNQI